MPGSPRPRGGIMPEITLEKLEELLGPNLPGTKQQLERLQRIVAQENRAAWGGTGSQPSAVPAESVGIRPDPSIDEFHRIVLHSEIQKQHSKHVAEEYKVISI